MLEPRNNKPAHEFGEAITYTVRLDEALVDKDLPKQMLERQAEALKTTLGYITDMEFGDIAYVQGPTTDLLGRTKALGYHFLGYSVGYSLLQKHFECKKQHVPYIITPEFIATIIEQYKEQEVQLALED